MLIRKSANTRPAAKLITSRYRKTPWWARAGIVIARSIMHREN